MKKIENKTIRLTKELSEDNKNELQKKLFKIKEKDREFHHRKNIIYIITVPKIQSASVNQHYQIEKEYFNKNISIDRLKEQIEQIKNPKCKLKEYSGPKWLGSDQNIEIPGNKIGFADETNNTLEIFEIIDVNKFCRRDKRPEWKEKENRGKNILFLSPMIKKMKLSKFKENIKYSKLKHIDNMSKFEFKF
jgi:hypothetical protein